MKLRRFLSLLLAFVMAFTPVLSLAETDEKPIPQTLTYKGGVIERSYRGGLVPRGIEELELSYMLSSAPYIILGEPTVWDLVIGGGEGPYTCEVILAHQADLSMDPFRDRWSAASWFSAEDPSFTYTFTEPGRYFWQFTITDSARQSLMFQTRIYEAYTAADELNDQTVVGKVNSIIENLITPSMSDYTRALVLHDWLIYNANYDYTYTHYEAAGVLLLGTGVCDSYARAYLMLMTAAGVDCMIVSGTGNGGAHAWNLVKLDGSWYHVDCTWDDPNKGGYERHTYFCLDDETMAKDHDWNRPGSVTSGDGMLVPGAEGGPYEYAAPDSSYKYDFTFDTVADFEASFNAMLAAGQYLSKFYGLYTGSASHSTIWSELKAWSQTRCQELANQGLLTGYSNGYSGDVFNLGITWSSPAEYVRIKEESLRLSIGDPVTVKATEYFTVSGNFTWTSSNPAVAAVTGSYDAGAGPSVTVTGLSAGEATITVTSVNGLTDSFDVTVLPAFEPDFNLAMSEKNGMITLGWDLIPGATEYQVVLSVDGTETILSTVKNGQGSVDADLLRMNALNEVYVKARRVIGNNVQLSYTSEKFAFVELTFDSYLPSGLVTIDSQAFAGSGSLRSVYIPDGANTISDGAFSGCDGLISIRIPASVSAFPEDVFEGSALRFVSTPEGSAAEAWFETNMPAVTIVHE